MTFILARYLFDINYKFQGLYQYILYLLLGLKARGGMKNDN